MNRGAGAVDPMLEDTIIAVSTPPGYGGLGVVRLSGPNALPVAKVIFRPRRLKWRALQPRALVFGDIQDGENKTIVDEAFLVYFAAPRSYTTENIVEISCHGSPVVLDEIVRLGVKAGARLAHPGEFTLRAYLRGRIDLLQAEAVNDLIEAASLAQARISLGQLRGGLSRQVGALRSEIVELMSLVESGIEFPEEVSGISAEEGAKRLGALIQAVRKHQRVRQMGNQRRSWPWVIESIEALHAGELGQVHFARGWYTNHRTSIGHGKPAAVPDWRQRGNTIRSTCFALICRPR